MGQNRNCEAGSPISISEIETHPSPAAFQGRRYSVLCANLVKMSSSKLTLITPTKLFLFFITLLPIFYLIYTAIRLSVDIPSFDEWYYIPMFEKMLTGSLTPGDLWAKVNEHRLVIPKLVMLLFVQFTGWNLKYMIALSILFGIFIFLLLAKFLARETKIPGRYSYFYVLPVVSLLIFSLVQYENWLWGLQSLMFINELAMLVGFYYLTNDKLGSKEIFFSILVGFVASQSHLSGLLFWLIGLLLVILNPRSQKKVRRKFALTWVIISIIAFATYFIGYFDPTHNSSVSFTFLLTHTLKTLALTLEILGSPLELFNRNIATLIGFFGLTLFASIYFLTYKVNKLTNFGLFLLALVMYGVANSAMTAIGRVSYNYPYIISRYSTFPTLFWVALVLLIFSLFDKKTKGVLVKKLGAVFLIIIVCL